MSTRILIGTGTDMDNPVSVAMEISNFHHGTLRALPAPRKARIQLPGAAAIPSLKRLSELFSS
eukprot:m.184610 g.184610  ORF g.184610 m.184610 type:complete len:63 (+) comp10510_c0_seq1:561-749(+)